MTFVIDASVVVKWLFDDPDNERYTALATDLMAAVVAGDVDVVQPPHWLIEARHPVQRRQCVGNGDQSGRMRLAMTGRRNPSTVPHYASGLARAALGDLQQGAQGLVDGGAVGECP